MEGVNFLEGREISCKTIGYNGELVVAEIFRSIGVPCQVTGYKHPLDIIAPGLGIEVKTATCIRRICISRPQRRRKREWCQRNGVHGITVVVRPIDTDYNDDTGKITEYSLVMYKDGFRSFDITRMNDFKEVLNEFYGKI